jgi:hypothetical protein
MLSNFIKRASIAALPIFVSTSSSFGLVLSAVVCLGACFACREAYRSAEYGWLSLFVAVALIFSTPFLAPLPYSYAVLINLLCLGVLVSSLVHSRELLTERVGAKRRGT